MDVTANRTTPHLSFQKRKKERKEGTLPCLFPGQHNVVDRYMNHPWRSKKTKVNKKKVKTQSLENKMHRILGERTLHKSKHFKNKPARTCDTTGHSPQRTKYNTHSS